MQPGLLTGTLALVLALSACAPSTPAPTQADLNSLYTQAAQTMAVQFTQTAQSAGPSPVISATPEPTKVPTSAPSETPPPPSATLVLETPTPEPPTETPAPVFPSPTPIPCDLASYEAELTVPEGNVLAPGQQFTQFWRLRNIGSCTWNQGYALAFVSGNAMSDQVVFNLSESVPPQATIDLSLVMTAPDLPGNYKSSWMLRNPNGNFFGVGDSGMEPLAVSVKVISPNPEDIFDFTANYCTADWSSGKGALDCPGEVDNRDGFVVYLDNPQLESGPENEPALWVHPNRADDGWISGVYPAMLVRKGDRFVAWIGCLEDSQGCDVIFRLDYQVAGGSPANLAAWREVYDGSITNIVLDLSSLAGKDVEFILGVQVNNDIPEQAEAFWLAPSIQEEP